MPFATASRLSLVLGLLLAGCANVRSSGDPGFRLQAGDTFGWSLRSETAELGEGLEGEIPWRSFRIAIARKLESAGLVEATADQPDLIVDAGMSVELDIENNHPNFEFYIAEKFERATFTLRFEEVAEPRRTWEGEFVYRLRETERLVGGAVEGNWHPANQDRDWKVQEVVERVFEAAPR